MRDQLRRKVATGGRRVPWAARKNQAKILDRMRNTHQPQGIWRNNELAVEAERLAPPFEGTHIIDMGRDVGAGALVRRAADGTLVLN
jgi:hypothetical protein